MQDCPELVVRERMSQGKREKEDAEESEEEKVQCEGFQSSRRIKRFERIT